MKLFKLNTLRRLKQDEEGVTVVEYGIALAVALGISAVAYQNLSNSIAGSMAEAETVMPGTAIDALNVGTNVGSGGETPAEG